MATSVTESVPKLFSLRVHQATQNENDIIISQQASSELRPGDIVEIYKDDNDKTTSHIILKISICDETIKTKGTETVSIVDTICSNSHFNFKTFNQVYVRKVVPKPVDLVVVTCKDTYLSRSDMWRMKKYLNGTCVYIDKRLSYLEMKMQLSISEIWFKGERLACGYISNNTRVCFRSSSSVLHIFLQMSAEMWEYDSYGDLYFEKAVSGFLTDLFDKWKNAESGHDVTIVMFSRTFYEAKKIEDFPLSMRTSVQRDSDNRFYEDFYRVVIKNERYDDWKSTLMKMKQLFTHYEDKVLRVSERAINPSIPKAYNSSAAQGNYLEVINMSLNVFEKYFLDRNFDRLGKTAVVITPGPGVFEVDKDLMSITKHRTIDTGSAADLICMGEQPLHTVPWFKVKERDTQTEVTKIPKSWINHSFYTSQSQIRITSTTQFVPRIKVASRKTEQELLDESLNRIRVFSDICEDEQNGDIDYDAYDRAVFNTNIKRIRSSGAIKKAKTKPRVGPEDADRTGDKTSETSADTIRRTTSMISTRSGNQTEKEGRMVSFSQEDEEISFNASSGEKMDAAMSNSLQRKLDKLVDPFKPNSANKQISANERRWGHAFPLNKYGQEIQPHHISVDDPRLPISSHKLLTSSHARVKLPKNMSTESRLGNCDLSRPESSCSLDENPVVSPHSYMIVSSAQSDAINFKKEIGQAMLETEGAEFSLNTKTGVDWRSLTTPALLPITTDYYPDEQHFQKLYQVQNYMLDPQLNTPSNYAEFFNELVSIRLALGFQLIPDSGEQREPADAASKAISSITRARNKAAASKETYRLSVGKIFHELSFNMQDCSIMVKVQQPLKTVKKNEIQYRYQFMSPDCADYNVSVTRFVSEQPENYKWNLLDNYVLNRGFKDDENSFVSTINNESMKYWCSRFCLLPNNNNPKVRKIREAKIEQNGLPLCDIFNPVENKDFARYNDGFIRFLLELINCVKRIPPVNNKSMNTSNNLEERPLDVTKLDLRKLVEQMKDPSNGLSFVDGKAAGLPSGTFISYEAMLWVKHHCKHVHDNNGALSVLQKLLDEKFIEHINYTNHNHDQYMCGFYLFYITSMHRSSPIVLQDPPDELFFEKEWVEVSLAVLPNDNSSGSTVGSAPSSLQRQVSSPSKLCMQYTHTPNNTVPPFTDREGYKWSDIDAHVSRLAKNELRRVEWTSFKYHCFYHPCCGFDFELNWIVATGGLLSEMINSWRRRLGNIGFHLLPIPVDPFALPTEKNSDPLRGPLFVPLNSDVISSIPSKELVGFMRYLIKRFGFIPIIHDYMGTEDPSATQFIHTTGGFFVLLQTRNSSADNSKQAGFIWSWNFMMTKQWWGPSSGDEMFEDIMLADFRRLTANHNGRLERHKAEWNASSIK